MTTTRRRRRSSLRVTGSALLLAAATSLAVAATPAAAAPPPTTVPAKTVPAESAPARNAQPQLAVPLPPVNELNLRGGWRAADNTPKSRAAAAAVPEPPQPLQSTPPDIAAAAEQQMRPMAAAGAHVDGDWQRNHRRRMSAVLNGHAYTPDQPLGDYWHEQSVEFSTRNRRIVQKWHAESVQFQQNHRHIVVESAGAIRQFVTEMRAPDVVVDVPDAYSIDSLTAELGPVRTVSSVRDEPASDASRRLTRDITSISPTLGYALRGIDRSQLPAEFFERMDNGEYVAREPSPTVLQWAPTNLWHHPLYFEDPALERYGHTYHPVVQPFASTARFSTQLVGLPYQMALHPVHARQYTLGWYRPGEHAPKLHYQIPFNQEAAMTQAAAIAGLLLIIP